MIQILFSTQYLYLYIISFGEPFYDTIIIKRNLDNLTFDSGNSDCFKQYNIFILFIDSIVYILDDTL